MLGSMKIKTLKNRSNGISNKKFHEIKLSELGEGDCYYCGRSLHNSQSVFYGVLNSKSRKREMVIGAAHYHCHEIFEEENEIIEKEVIEENILSQAEILKIKWESM